MTHLQSILCLVAFFMYGSSVQVWKGKKDVGPRYSASYSPLVSPLSLLVHLITEYSNLN